MEEQAQEEQQEDGHKHQRMEGKQKLNRENCWEQVFHNLLGLRPKKMGDCFLAPGMKTFQSAAR